MAVRTASIHQAERGASILALSRRIAKPKVAVFVPLPTKSTAVRRAFVFVVWMRNVRPVIVVIAKVAEQGLVCPLRSLEAVQVANAAGLCKKSMPVFPMPSGYARSVMNVMR